VLDLKDIKQQVARLGGLNLPPITPEGWTELAKVLQRRCLTMDHVERVLDRWLAAEENVPKPSQLGSLCSDVSADPKMDHPILPGPCEECAPEGLFRWVERLDRDGQPVTCPARCTCARGRQPAAMDAKRTREGLGAATNRKQPIRLTRVGRAER
jgi:hypothetical protein